MVIWSDFTWGSKESTTIGKTDPTLLWVRDAFENQLEAEQNLSCKWSIKLAQKSYIYKIFIKGAAFGECNREVSKLSGKIRTPLEVIF